MSYPVINTCPICHHTLHVKKLECSHCHTTIENDFTLSRFSALSDEQMQFVEVFLLKRGNIKEVEKALGISYPTVRSKLNDIIDRLGHDSQSEKQAETASDIMTMLENDKISPGEAVERLKHTDGGNKI